MKTESSVQREESLDTFGERLFILRQTHGYIQKQVYMELGCSHSAYVLWESGKTSMNINALRRLRRVYPDLDYNWLLGGEENP